MRLASFTIYGIFLSFGGRGCLVCAEYMLKYGVIETQKDLFLYIFACKFLFIWVFIRV